MTIPLSDRAPTVLSIGPCSMRATSKSNVN
jgi:hypothetical protein